MKFFCRAIFVFFLVPSPGWSLEEKNISLEFSGPVTSKAKHAITEVVSQTEVGFVADSVLSEDTKLDAFFESKNRVQGKRGESVSVIKGTELKPILDSIYEKHKTYFSINRYERVVKPPSDDNQAQLQIELTRDIKPTIRVIDKPLVLGGDGFGAGLKGDEYKLHFTFNSHIKVPSIYQVEKEDLGYLDPDFEKAQSEKFLIFHRSSLNFARQANIIEEFKFEQPLEQKVAYIKVEAVPSSWIFLDSHVKDFQNKETSIRLIPAKKRLDLIYDNPAILRYDYQILNSGGS